MFNDEEWFLNHILYHNSTSLKLLYVISDFLLQQQVGPNGNL